MGFLGYLRAGGPTSRAQRALSLGSPGPPGVSEVLPLGTPSQHSPCAGVADKHAREAPVAVNSGGLLHPRNPHWLVWPFPQMTRAPCAHPPAISTPTLEGVGAPLGQRQEEEGSTEPSLAGRGWRRGCPTVGARVQAWPREAGPSWGPRSQVSSSALARKVVGPGGGPGRMAGVVGPGLWCP